MALMLLAPEIIIYGLDPTRLQGSQAVRRLCGEHFRVVALHTKVKLSSCRMGTVTKGFA